MLFVTRFKFIRYLFSHFFVSCIVTVLILKTRDYIHRAIDTFVKTFFRNISRLVANYISMIAFLSTLLSPDYLFFLSLMGCINMYRAIFLCSVDQKVALSDILPDNLRYFTR